MSNLRKLFDVCETGEIMTQAYLDVGRKWLGVDKLRYIYISKIKDEISLRKCSKNKFGNKSNILRYVTVGH